MSADIEDLIQAATKHRNDEAYSAVFAAMKGQKVFANIVMQKRGDPNSKAISHISLSGRKHILFFTSKEHRGLTGEVQEMTWEQALGLIIRAADASALLLQGAKAWIAVTKDKAQALLAAA